jgi:hypothetical protein
MWNTTGMKYYSGRRFDICQINRMGFDIVFRNRQKFVFAFSGDQAATLMALYYRPVFVV